MAWREKYNRVLDKQVDDKSVVRDYQQQIDKLLAKVGEKEQKIE